VNSSKLFQMPFYIKMKILRKV